MDNKLKNNKPFLDALFGFFFLNFLIGFFFAILEWIAQIFG